MADDSLKLERALHSSKRFLADILASIQDGISVLDRDLTVRHVNPVMNRWYEANVPLEGKKCYACYHNSDRPCDPCPTLMAFRSGMTECVVVPGLPGSPIEWVELFSYPIKDEKTGEITGVVEFVRDITARRRAERERLELEARIQQAQKLESLGVLAGGIAHDFNNLLVGMLGNADLALMQLEPGSPVSGVIAKIETAARRATELIRQMLAYAGKARFVTERIELPLLVEEMAHLLEATVSKKAVLRYEFADGVPPIEADATQIRQIVMNLITNASDALGEQDGVISIRTGVQECDRAYLSGSFLDDDLPEGAYCWFEVSDPGCGMDEHTRRRIFDPFFSTKMAGRGLGLAAALGIVRGHEGAIRVESEPGRGSTFRVLLPAPGAIADRRQAAPPAADLQGRGRTVLLVDDEEMVREVGRSMLELQGFRVMTAKDGQEGLEMFRRDPDVFCCVILDLTMPRLSGEECFRQLRRVRQDATVIMTSGYDEQESIDRVADEGLAGFIPKPFCLSSLVNKLAEVLD